MRRKTVGLCLKAHLMSVCTQGWREATSQPKVSNLEQFGFPVNQDVLRLQVSMENPVGMTEVQAAQQLVQEHLRPQGTSLLHPAD